MSALELKRQRGSRWRLVAPLGIALAIAFVYAVFPRRADLTRFEPAAMARLETAMWRDYYEHRYFALFADLYDVARNQQGFSPMRSLRVAVTAAGAAKVFQPTRSRAEAQAALPWLAAYFRVLARAAPHGVDIEAVAQAELDWWQARREGITADDYGLKIARVTALVYGTDGEEVRAAGIRRAQAMAYRDARGAAMSDVDWRTIEKELRTSYELLKRAVAPPLQGA